MQSIYFLNFRKTLREEKNGVYIILVATIYDALNFPRIVIWKEFTLFLSAFYQRRMIIT